MIQIIKIELRRLIFLKVLLMLGFIGIGFIELVEANFLDDVMVLFIVIFTSMNFYLSITHKIATKDDFILKNLPILKINIIKGIYISQIIWLCINILFILSVPAIAQFGSGYVWNIHLESIMISIGASLLLLGILTPLIYLFKDAAQWIYLLVFLMTMSGITRIESLFINIKQWSLIIFIVGIIVYVISYMISKYFYLKYE